MRLVLLTLAAVLALAGPARAGFTAQDLADQPLQTATLVAPVGFRCTSTLNAAGPVSLTWSAPPALAGRVVTYTVERRSGSGAWSTIWSGTTTSVSDDPAALLALGTVWQYRVHAGYRSWTSPLSTTVSASYTKVLLVTVLSTCATVA